MSPDDFDSLPPDDSSSADDLTGHDPDVGDPDPDADELGGDDDTSASTVESHGGEEGTDLETLFAAGGALELPPDPAGEHELARWLDQPAPAGPEGELRDFAERLARRLRGE